MKAAEKFSGLNGPNGRSRQIPTGALAPLSYSSKLGGPICEQLNVVLIIELFLSLHFTEPFSACQVHLPEGLSCACLATLRCIGTMVLKVSGLQELSTHRWHNPHSMSSCGFSHHRWMTMVAGVKSVPQ